MAYTKRLLSGSTSGKGVLVVATATAGTLIHTAFVGALDEIWLYAVNSSAAAVKLTIEYGGPAVADNIECAIPAESGLYLVVPGLLLSGELTVKAFAATPNVVTIHGFVNAIT